MNKSMNISRYSINIEAQNDIGKITILLNDQEEGDRGLGVRVEEEEDEMLEIDDGDSVSDKNKSIYFESTGKSINFKQMNEGSKGGSKYIDSRILD